MSYALVPARQRQRVFDELKLALSLTTAEDLKAWGATSARLLPAIGKRRIRNFGALLCGLTRFTGRELGGVVKAWRRGNTLKHLGKRAEAGLNETIDFGKRAWVTVETIARAVSDNPRENAPGVLALALGFVAGSGGIDGNGGIPDTDIALFGIGDHRSLLTHSIIAGVVAEGAILALADLAGIVCDKLPAGQRSSFWDTLSNTKEQIAGQLAIGTSAGIAYHLAVDATLQPAAYKDLPISMPMEGHQTLFAMNAVVEGGDAISRKYKAENRIRKNSNQKVVRHEHNE